MPTASTAQILGNNESIEPYTSNIYTRRVLSGEFQVVNQHLLKDLVDLGLWDVEGEMKQKLIAHNGSIQVRKQKNFVYIKSAIFSRTCIGNRRHSRRIERALQNRLGNSPEDVDQHGGGSRRFYRSKPVVQRLHCRAEFREIDEHAFLRMEKGRSK